MNDRIPGMRKSEALLRLKTILNSWALHDPSETSDVIAEKILSEVVDIWGRPPGRCADLRSSYGYATVYEWEPEMDFAPNLAMDAIQNGQPRDKSEKPLFVWYSPELDEVDISTRESGFVFNDKGVEFHLNYLIHDQIHPFKTYQFFLIGEL